MSLVRYFNPSNGELVDLSRYVMEHLQQYQQVAYRTPEAGGQLFWTSSPQTSVLVETITGPRERDKRRSNNYQPDRKAEQQEIQDQFERQRYYFGDWHTHPEKVAFPSLPDLKTIEDIYQKSDTMITERGIYLLVVGTAALPDSMTLRYYDGQWTECRLIETTN